MIWPSELFVKTHDSRVSFPFDRSEGEYDLNVNPSVANTAMGKPPFKASEGGLFEILRSWKDFTLSELQFHKGMGEMLR
jgi:hypothetical protein